MRDRALAADQHLRSALKIIGGKTGSTKDSTRSRIYEMMPKGVPYYGETFLGSGGILVGKPKSEREMVNDINPFVINYYRCLKKDPKRLWGWMQHFVRGMSEEKFAAIRMNHPAFETEQGYATAGWFYAINRFARNGIIRFNQEGNCNSTWCGQANGRGLFDEEWYEKVYERIKHVKFYNKHYADFLTTQITDPENTFVVLDPPYIDVFTSYMGIKFSREDQLELARILRKAKFYWLLTINDHPLVRKWYAPFVLHKNEVFYSCSNTSKGRGRAPELIITNY